MITRRLGCGAGDLAEAATILRAGGLVAFPTETVYGLGGDAWNAEAVARIFAVKGRPADNPLIVHLASADGIGEVACVGGAGAAGDHDRAASARGAAGQGGGAAVTPRVEAAGGGPPLPAASAATRAGAALRELWPGPLTLVLARRPGACAGAAAGLDTIAVRVPAHPVARDLIRRAGRPIAAPSANRSGRPSPTTAAAVLEDLDGRIDAVVDGGPTPVGVESTVVDATADPPCVLRLGGIPLETLRRLVPGIVLGGDARRSPGTRYRHYAPTAPVILAAPERLPGVVAANPGAAVLCTDETAGRLPPLAPAPGRPPVPVARLGPLADDAAHAQRLFDALRRLDALHPAVIVAEELPARGLDAAVMDRLRRAAGAAARGGKGA